MGLQDNDEDQNLQREREKQRQIDATRARFSAFSQNNLAKKTVSPIKTGLIPMMIFWCLVMGFLYWGMTHYLKPKQAQVRANGDLVISRSKDGHFYATGTVNGREARFMVDTGASLVSVSESFALKASIGAGVPATFRTANGDRPGRIVEGLSVAIGPLSVTNIKVGIGLHGGDESDALLGQSFLSKFDMTMSNNQMVLRAR
jgi:aspartyl protease family protein